MNKLCDDIYEHRGLCIFKDEQGIWVEDHFELFATWRDAKAFVDNLIDGSATREPKIIGYWKDPKENAREDSSTKSKRSKENMER